MRVELPITIQFVRYRGRRWQLQRLGLVAAATFFCACSATQEPLRPVARTAPSREQIESEVFRRVNDYRESRSLQRLVPDRDLARLARGHSERIARRGRLDHRGSGGRFRVLQRQPTALISFAENVAYNFGHADPAQVAVNGWLRSPGHHRNILRADDRLTGVGAAQAADGSWYLTQVFGRQG